MFLRTGCNRNAEKNSEALATENGQQSIVSNSLQSKPIHSLKKPLKVKNRDCYLVIFTKSLITSKRVHNNLFVLRYSFLAMKEKLITGFRSLQNSKLQL